VADHSQWPCRSRKAAIFASTYEGDSNSVCQAVASSKRRV
jgi:hypothetical protein